MARLILEYKLVCGKCHQELDFVIHDAIEPEEISIEPCKSCKEEMEEEKEAIHNGIRERVKKEYSDKLKKYAEYLKDSV